MLLRLKIFTELHHIFRLFLKYSYFHITAQMGTDFILAFPTANKHNVLDVHIYIVSTKAKFTGTISTPIPGVSRNFSTTTGSVTLHLPKTAILPEGKSDEVIHIQTSSPVAVYGMLHRSYFIAEGFLVYPTTYLGTDYIAVAGDVNSFLTLLSTDDSTTVNVKVQTAVKYGGHSISGGSHVQITMDKYEAVQLTTISGDLSGSTIHSNKPIAVITGNPCTSRYSSFCNYLAEYLSPNTTCGQQFIVPPFNGSTRHLNIFATKDNTAFSMEGVVSTKNITVTTRYPSKLDLNLQDPYTITTDHPVCVYMVFVIGKSPMLTAIPSIDQYVNDAVVPAPEIATYNNYLSVITKSSSLSNLRLDNRALSPSHLSNIYLNGEKYSTFWVDLQGTAETHRLTGATATDVFGAIAYGYTKNRTDVGLTYGYPAAWNFHK